MHFPTRKEAFNIPNILTYIRLLLVPVFVYYYYTVETGTIHFYSTWVLLISAITDFLDGYIARHYNLITDWGRLMDPIADKVTQFTVAIALVSTYSAYAWVLAVMLVKDGMLLFFQYYIYHNSGKRLTQAEVPGKIATVIFFVVSIFLLVFRIPGTLLANILIYTTTIALLMALSNYGTKLIGYYNEMKD